MSEGKPQPPRRIILWTRDPRCFWCGRVTRLDVKENAPNLATIDHLYSRAHPKRQSKNRHLPPSVLACRQCNCARGAKGATTGETCPVY
jgi:hypothetical protein